MDFRFFIDEPFWLLMALVLAYNLYRSIRYRGLRGGMLGARILKSSDAVHAGGVNGLSHELYVLASKAPEQEGHRQVGFEVRSRGALSYQMEVAALSGAAALELARLLRAAAVRSAS